ncbi:MAG: nickel-dependent lactate racemase family protein [Planctomycetota bacterium]|jgi:nickel-dependent lactate racemase
MQTLTMLYGKEGLILQLPDDATILTGQHPPAIDDPDEAVRAALASPIASPPLSELIAAKGATTVAITVSDITRPVPNKQFLPAMLAELNAAGIADDNIVIIVGTGMHRPSTPQELDVIVGADIVNRIETIDHTADKPETLTKVSDDPPVSVCTRFLEADFHIVTGYIEPHFMAGFSGGRKGVCPALVDLATLQRFHGYDTLADPNADNGVLEGNPCHAIALKVARTVGVDFLFNVAITHDRRMAGIYCGDLVEAHLVGCKQVAEWTTATIPGPFDLVITCGGGYPLDLTFYQTVKGMCTALPALGEHSTLLQVSHCGEQLGSSAYTELMMTWDGNWRGFLKHIEAHRPVTELDQWELQMQSRVLNRIGVEKLLFVTDGIDPHTQTRMNITPVLGEGDAATRAQRAIDDTLAAHPGASVAVIPEGPYTMLRVAS